MGRYDFLAVLYGENNRRCLGFLDNLIIHHNTALEVATVINDLIIFYYGMLVKGLCRQIL